MREIPYLGGISGTLKVKQSCQSLHLAKIQGMKSISKPRLPIEIYTFQEIMSTEEQEEVLVFLRKSRPPAKFKPYTYQVNTWNHGEGVNIID